MNLAGWPQRLKVINVYFTQQRDVRKQIVTIRRDAKYIGKKQNKTKQIKNHIHTIKDHKYDPSLTIM